MSREPLLPAQAKKLLIITSSGGGGLIQTANAKEQEARAKHPSLKIVKQDMLVDWVWKPMGRLFITFWNTAQKRGDVLTLKLFVSAQFSVDFFLHPFLFCRALYTLFKEDVDHIIDTQIFGTSAIVKALRIYNWRKNKNVVLEKVLVDLPTKKATHFFRPIKKLSKKNRKFIRLTTISPILEEGETDEAFWQATCGLSKDKVNLEDVYVRRAFHEFKGKARPAASFSLKVAYKSEEELALMKHTFSKGAVQFTVASQEVSFQLEPTDRVYTFLLGSQPARNGSLSYVEKMIAHAKRTPEVNFVLFVYCGDHKVGGSGLFRDVHDLIKEIQDYPTNVSVIPFSFQNEEVIAPLFFRSDVACTRSGGQTAMELMCVSTGEIWIHSEAKPGRDPLSGIPGWEAASAVYLQKLKGAKVVTPELISDYAEGAYQMDSEQALKNRALRSSA